MTGVRDEVPADLAGREYDLTSRHLLVARIVRELCRPGDLVLDVGGAAGLTQRFLPGFQVVTTDILRESVDVVASGDHLPFADMAFRVAVVLDVLEHVPEESRFDLLRETARVSDSVLVAGPFDTDGVRDAEARQRAFFEALHGRRHPWLEEHLQCGVPELGRVIDEFASLGFQTAHFGSNPLPLWEELLENTHLALRVGLDDATRELRSSLLDDFLALGDGTPPSYRHLILASRDSDPDPVMAAVAPGIDPTATQAAIEMTAVNTARVIDEGLRHIDRYRDEVERGWRDSVEQVRTLEDTLEDARSQWQATVDAYAHLESDMSTAHTVIARLEADLLTVNEAYSETAQKYFATEQSRRAAESSLIASPPAWLADVSLPGDGRPPAPPTETEAYARWIRADLADASEVLASGPRISVLVPVFNPRAEFLEECIRSVRRQTYRNWELVLLDVSDEPHVQPICARFQAVDDRIRILTGANAGIAENTNVCAKASTGDYFALLDHDDELAPHALSSIAAAIREHPHEKIIYSDEDAIDENGERSNPFFKPAWSPDLLRHVNYITHLMVIRRDLWTELGGMRSDTDGAQDFDMALRATHAAGGALHIPDVLYHWRRHEGSTASDVTVKPYAHFAGRSALEQFINEVAPGARVEFGTGPTSHRVRYPTSDTRIAAIVPFKDAAELTEQCLTGLAATRGGHDVEVLLVDNRSTDPNTRESMRRWESRWPWVRGVSFDEPFNFQRLNNWAVKQTDAETLLFLNNDTQPVHEGWLDAMLEHAQRPEIGAVGARLFFPDGTIQHAGVVVGMGGFADHPWSQDDPTRWTAAGPSYWTRNFLAVTAACLMVERRKFEEVGGFDTRFTIGGGDVDLGIRLHERGYWNVYTPFARLLHHESASRGTVVPTSDLTESARAYAHYVDGADPFYNPNLSLEEKSVRIDGTEAAVTRRRRVVARSPRQAPDNTS